MSIILGNEEVGTGVCLLIFACNRRFRIDRGEDLTVAFTFAYTVFVIMASNLVIATAMLL